MQIGIIGLGRMGGNMARRLSRGGVRVTGYDPSAAAAQALAKEGAIEAAASLQALAAALPMPRVFWMMVPAGDATETTFEALLALASPGDLVVDGGNAHYKDSERRAAAALARGIEFVDCGVSGGIWGLEEGYALMFGASDTAAARMAPIARVLAPAPDRGWLRCGPPGSGHFVKMIHNGIEYGMMQAFAEGFALMRGKESFKLDVGAIAEAWRHGSVVRSWLLDLTAEFLAKDAELAGVAPVVADSGEGRWTVSEAIEQGVPAPVLAIALMNRFDSQGKGDYAAKLLAMMRKGFGGHAVTRTP
ncbi:MAG TPA: decarboxylating 6-phosphogluconate dehydrogenase [Casimicrobiaceae bacterium]|jgi:6-phosphogluconate dehydrogenase|nr:decarboxylating 6-phosphogluconate dehydrogenase [Casimicrobiaceae bacterium]